MYDIIVVGGGHAGCEAALAGARLGFNVGLITQNKSKIALMPCNPSIGGPAKGIVVREIDALGGQMGIAANRANLQIKMLNTKKGPAVRSLRAQVDNVAYPQIMQEVLEEVENITIVEDEVSRLNINDNRISGVTLKSGTVLAAKQVILTSGTYLNSEVLVGRTRIAAGPEGTAAVNELVEDLRENNIDLMRFKTGTPPRVKSSSINWEILKVQPGDKEDLSFTYTDEPVNDQNIACYLTYTTEKTHQIIQDNLSESPMYSGDKRGTGPRYCPSIEDKVVRFADKERHQVFLEPESLSNDLIYVQGVSTSFSKEIQDEIIHSVIGLEKAIIDQYGYAIEYEAIDPRQLKPSLEFKNINGLFSAGQINGTSGYEEAAGQGLIAGINAARAIDDLEPLILRRTNSYIGLLIDDLVTKGTNEPYRLLTSRSEYRLLLRHDNADERLTPFGYQMGLVSATRYQSFQEKMERIDQEIKRLEKAPVDANDSVNGVLEQAHDFKISNGLKAIELLRRPEVSYRTITKLIGESDLNAAEIDSLVIKVKYQGYIEKMYEEVQRIKKLEELIIPEDFDYKEVHNLASEALEKLMLVQPINIAQASRISGVTPADIAILSIHVKEVSRGLSKDD